MNFGRLIVAAIAGTVVEVVYGFLVYGMLLSKEFGRYPAVYRSAEAGPAYLPLMFAGLFVAIFLAAVIYAQGYTGGRGAEEGTRFGVLLGAFVSIAFGSVNYGVLNIGRRLAVYTTSAGFIEWFLIGLTIGLVYKPAGAPARQAASV
jgi:hypothetical protein